VHRIKDSKHFVDLPNSKDNLLRFFLALQATQTHNDSDFIGSFEYDLFKDALGSQIWLHERLVFDRYLEFEKIFILNNGL
jgi:hypothetical protein